MKLKLFFIILLNLFLVLVIVIFFKNKKSVKKSHKSIKKETKIDTFFQKRKPTIDEIDSSYNAYVLSKDAQKKHSINKKKYTKKYKTKDKLPISVIKKQMDAIESPIRFEYNELVGKFLDKYAFKQKHQTAKFMGLSEYYFPMFEEALHKKGLPLELKYLPIIESSLRCNVVSSEGAAGLWQLMFPTAETYGLNITSYIDERRDPILSTKVAVTYLKDMFGIYQDWFLTIAAYNCGPGSVNKAIRSADGSINFWDIYKYLPKETRDYVPAFIAIVYTFKYHNHFDIKPKKNNYPSNIEDVTVNKTIHLKQIASWFKLAPSLLERLNPMFIKQIVPSTKYKKYNIKLPYKYISKFTKQEEAIYKYHRKKYFGRRDSYQFKTLFSLEDYIDTTDKKVTYYIVKKGDIIGSIARKYEVPVAAIKSWNNIERDNIFINQKLKIYIPDNQPFKGGIWQTNSSKERSTIIYTVEAGDVVGIIARKFEVKEASLVAWNNIKNNKIYVGQKLKIYLSDYPTTSKKSLKNTTARERNLIYYTVKEGDVIGIIARKFEVKEAKLKEWNNIKNDKIFINQKLKIYVSKEKSLNNRSDKETQSKDKKIIYYTVKPGDVIGTIARKFNVSEESLKQWNNLKNDRIYVNQKLKILN